MDSGVSKRKREGERKGGPVGENERFTIFWGFEVVQVNKQVQQPHTQNRIVISTHKTSPHSRRQQ